MTGHTDVRRHPQASGKDRREVQTAVLRQDLQLPGLWDWNRRYRRRSYRQIRLKIAFSVLFLALGGFAIALHASGAVFSTATGLVDLSSPVSVVLATVELALLIAGMAVIATLGHVGGTLVYGK